MFVHIREENCRNEVFTKSKHIIEGNNSEKEIECGIGWKHFQFLEKRVV